MDLAHPGVSVSLRVRVCTRLAWLDVFQTDFAFAIGMDKSVFSRALRASLPHDHTLELIAGGLGLSVGELTGSDPTVLLCEHPALSRSMARPEKVEAIQAWMEQRS